jgi:RecA/RadA recombinase
MSDKKVNKFDNSALIAKMRASLNERAGTKLTQQVESIEELLQVEDWIEMPEYFQRAVGAKGFPEGHITQCIGESDTGKSTLIMTAMIQVQKLGGIVYLIDSEHKFDFVRFQQMGGNPKDIITIVVDSLEAAWNAFDTVLRDLETFRKTDKSTKALLVWDSVPASCPDRILESDAEDSHVSVEAKINNINVRKLRKRIKTCKATALFINHGYMTLPKFGVAKEVIKGGSEMYYMSTLILKTKRRAWLKRTINGIDEKFGTHSLLEVFKGHLGGIKATTPFYIVGQGILPNEEKLNEYKDWISGMKGSEISNMTLEELELNYLEKKDKKPIKGKTSKKVSIEEVMEDSSGNEG